MKKRFVATIMASVLATALVTGCASGAAKEEPKAETAAEEAAPEEAQEAAPEDIKETAEAAEETAETEETATAEETEKTAEAFPEYVYTGEDPYVQPIYEYFRDNIKPDYEEADVFLPEFDILREDDTDPEDIKVWGDYHVANYSVRGTTFMFRSGGQYPGCFHLAKTGDGYEVKSVEFVEDGTDWTESVKKIFNDDELLAAFEAASADERDVRSYVIHSYAVENGMTIRAYQDYGWDPVQVDMDDKDFAADAQFPDIAGSWKSADSAMTMEIEAPDEGFTCGFEITGKDMLCSVYATYEMGTNTLWYWDCFVNDEQVLGEGTFALNEDNTITWTHEGEEVVFERA